MGEDLLQLGLVISIFGTVYLWWWAKECRCDHCAFHRHERSERARTLVMRQEEEQARRRYERHERIHRGWDYQEKDTDVWDCPDPACKRNKGRR